MSNLFTSVLTLQRSAAGGFSFVNGPSGIPLSSGQQFYIDSVGTNFFPPIPPGSTDPNKYRKQKWLSIGLEGNSFRRYINENISLSGIPSGLQPGSFVYFTIEPKSSLLEFGAGTQNQANARYISSLRAKPYMVVENDANKDNSYEKTPANLFTGVSGNNNFVKFHPSSRYGNLALQSIRFHPIIGNGFSSFNVGSGVILNLQPKNHHLETFIELTVSSGSRINYGNSSRIFPFQSSFPILASGRGILVTGSYFPEANGVYVQTSPVGGQSDIYRNENNWRMYWLTGKSYTDLVGADHSGEWVIVKPIDPNESFSTPPDPNPYDFFGFPYPLKFHIVYTTTGTTSNPAAYGTRSDIQAGLTVLSPTLTGQWIRMQLFEPLGEGEDGSATLVTSRLRNAGLIDSSYSIHSGLGGWNNFNNTTAKPTGAYVSPKWGTYSLPFSKINKYSRFTTNIWPLASSSSINSLAGSLRFFTPYFIFDNQELLNFPYSSSSSMLNELIIKEKIHFRRPLSPNLHQAKKVNVKFKYLADGRTLSNQTVIKNTWPIQEKTFNGYTKTVECYDERDNDTYSSTPFYVLSGKDYYFEQNEMFIYKSRPDFNNPNQQNVIKW